MVGDLVPRSRRSRATPRTRSRSRRPARCTHVRLSIYPDGGVARLRVHGEAVPDPRFLDGAIDLAAPRTGHGDRLQRTCSTPRRQPDPPGEARVMGEGWETARRRDDGNDWVTVSPRRARTCAWSRSTPATSSATPRLGSLRGRTGVAD